jgi:predicted ATPase
VFAGGFSLEAAEAVCTDNVVPRVLDGIASLVDKTLVRTEDPFQGQPRFTMLQVVRKFAVERLELAGEADGLRRAHADFFQLVVTGAAATWRRGGGRHAVEQYLADLANVRAAMRWSWTAMNGAGSRKWGWRCGLSGGPGACLPRASR